MCDATTLTVSALALTAAGTAATAYGANQADKAEGAATEAELARQKKLREEADSVQARTLEANSAQGTKKGMEEATQRRSAAYEQAAQDTANYAPLGLDRSGQGDAGNRVVADAYNRQNQQASNFVRQQGQARSALEAFEDTMTNNAIFNANQGYDIRRLGSFMQGSANVLPVELNAAGHRGDSAKTLGGILSALGSVAGAGAGSVGGLFAAGAGAASQGTTAATKKPTTTTTIR